MTNTLGVHIEPSWKRELAPTFKTDWFNVLREHIRGEYIKKRVFPPPTQVFRAFELTPFNDVSVVILGQDPYHGEGQANGLCFSVNENIPLPPSLKNIFKEMHDDVGKDIPENGDLTDWATQGVLLLNAVLTVLKGSPTSHADIGWEEFTDTVIRTLSEKRKGIVFLLWGAYAQKKRDLIDEMKHFVLTAPHPSPYSASGGFFGCKHFSMTNTLLKKQGKKTINW